MNEPQVRFRVLPVSCPVTGRFGEWYTAGARRWQHRGVDFGCPVGTTVRAPADGVVVPFANDGSFGIGVCLRHADGWHTLYAHLSARAVADGQAVRAGDVIGMTGATGFVTGPHLHWQLCRSADFPADIDQSRDPLRYYAAGEDEMTPQERELLLAIATILAGPATGANFGTVDEALAALRPLVLGDSIVMLGLARTQEALRNHTHGPDGRAIAPGVF